MGDSLSRERQACLFNRIDWLEMLHHAALSDKKPMLLRTKWQNSECWMPLMRAGTGHYESLANYYNFTWSPIFAGAHGEVVKITLLQYLARALARRAHRIDVREVPDEDESATLMVKAFEREGWICHRSQCDVNHILNVQGRSFDEYWASRPSQLRNTVRRKGNKGVVQIRVERRFIPEMWRDYETVYAKSWKPEEGSPQFLRQLAQREGAAGALRMGVAYIDGEAVAAQFWTCENGVALIHKLAHTEESLSHSPGTLLNYALMKEVIDEDRVRIVDFGTGNDGYKPVWMDAIRTRYHLRFLRPLQPTNWPVMVKYHLNRLAGRGLAD